MEKQILHLMTINEMLNNKNIKEKNLEVVEFVKKEI